MNNKELFEKAYEIYQEKGQSGVFDFANKYDIGYAYCPPCETSSPSLGGDCLVCGSPTEDEEFEHEMCKKHTDSEALPDEEGNCSLCGGDCVD